MVDENNLVTAPVTSASLPDNFKVQDAAALARDFAIGMFDRATILEKHELTDEQAKVLEANPYFQRLLEQMSVEWNSPKSAQERLALQTAIGLESVLPEAISRVKIAQEPLTGIAQMVKVLADIAGANNHNKQPQAPGEKFTITINLGADKKEVYEKTRPTITVEAAPSSPEEIPTQSEGFGSLLTLQPEPEKA